MATSTISPPSDAVQGAGASSASAVVAAAPEGTQALVPMAEEGQFPSTGEELEISGPLTLLPIELDVVVPVREFRVRNLLALEPGQLIETQWHNGDDVPLTSGQVQLAWSEFEVLETDLAVRITRMA